MLEVRVGGCLHEALGEERPGLHFHTVKSQSSVVSRSVHDYWAWLFKLVAEEKTIRAPGDLVYVTLSKWKNVTSVIQFGIEIRV